MGFKVRSAETQVRGSLVRGSGFRVWAEGF